MKDKFMVFNVKLGRLVCPPMDTLEEACKAANALALHHCVHVQVFKAVTGVLSAQQVVVENTEDVC